MGVKSRERSVWTPVAQAAVGLGALVAGAAILWFAAITIGGLTLLTVTLAVAGLLTAAGALALALERRWPATIALTVLALAAAAGLGWLTLGGAYTFDFPAPPKAPPPPRPPEAWAYGSIPVCWEDPAPQDASLRRAVEGAVMEAWEATGRTMFSWRDGCPDVFPGVRVSVTRDPIEKPHASAVGRAIVGAPGGLRLAFAFPAAHGCGPGGRWGSLEQCVRGEAVHEFGHVIGLADNHLSRAAPQACREPFRLQGLEPNDQPYDPQSVMNACNPDQMRGRPSAGDIERVRALYAASIAQYESEFGAAHPEHGFDDLLGPAPYSAAGRPAG